MRVLHVITALGVGGAERMLQRLLRARAMAGVEQRVVAMLPGGALAAPMRAGGTGVDELDFLGGLPLAGGAARLAAHARRFEPMVVHGWMYHGNLGALLARAVLRRPAPLVWSIRQSLRSLDGENAWARTAIRLNRLLSRRPDCMLFNSAASLEQHRALGFDVRRARHLANGFDTAALVPPDAGQRARARAAWGVADSDTVFGHVARFHPAKNQAGFLRAAARVHAVMPAAPFVMAGTGVTADNAALAATLAGLDLGGTVRLLGERDEIAGVLHGLDILVSPSLRLEAFPNAVGEAMSCGLPCVVTDVGDAASVLGGAGRVVPAGDDAALAAAMIALADAGAEARAALGREARSRIVAAWDIEAVAARHAALYAELSDAMRLRY